MKARKLYWAGDAGYPALSKRFLFACLVRYFGSPPGLSPEVAGGPWASQPRKDANAGQEGPPVRLGSTSGWQGESRWRRRRALVFRWDSSI